MMESVKEGEKGVVLEEASAGQGTYIWESRHYNFKG